MDRVGTRIEEGSLAVFSAYLDQDRMPLDERIFHPGQFALVAKVNEDGGLQCFPADETGKVISLEGDTLFPEEVVHLTYMPKLDVHLG